MVKREDLAAYKAFQNKVYIIKLEKFILHVTFQDPEYKSPKEQFESLFSDKEKQVNCPHCWGIVSAKHINVDLAFAKCENCNRLFSIEEEDQVQLMKDKVQMPLTGIIQSEYANGMDIKLSASSIHQFGHMVVFWGVIMAATIMCLGAMMWSLSSWMSFALISPFLFFSVKMFWDTICKVFNTLHISVDDRYLSVEHRPFKKLFAKQDVFIEREKVDHLFIQKYQKDDDGAFFYALYLQDTFGQDIRLLEVEGSDNSLRYLKQEIEEYLDENDSSTKEMKEQPSHSEESVSKDSGSFKNLFSHFSSEETKTAFPLKANYKLATLNDVGNTFGYGVLTIILVLLSSFVAVNSSAVLPIFILAAMSIGTLIGFYESFVHWNSDRVISLEKDELVIKWGSFKSLFQKEMRYDLNRVKNIYLKRTQKGKAPVFHVRMKDIHGREENIFSDLVYEQQAQDLVMRMNQYLTKVRKDAK